MKLWGGRFEKATSKAMEDFNSSIAFDKRLYKYDISGSIAHVNMLSKCSIISEDDAVCIKTGLKGILEDIENNHLEFDPYAEDIHMNIESILIQRIGDSGKKLHTARSRNDQIALDMRMYFRDEITLIKELLKKLAATLLNIAKAHIDTVMPGYTHMQRAQPVTLAHHIMAWFEMLRRDIGRLQDCFKRTNVMPLGTCALAGTTYPIDREMVARELGFDTITRNSMDSVSDRDFVLELLGCISFIMMHLSRFCEEVILWSTHEFKFIELDDSYSTGSSIMPQKKNPDAAELIRGKTGRVYGSMMGVFTMMKALPLTYNKDMQEDKEMAFDAIDTVKACINVFDGMISTTIFNKEKMHLAAGSGFTNATDFADYLVKKGAPFRIAHEITGKAVLYCIDNGKSLEDLPLEILTGFSELIENDIYEAISLEKCIVDRNIAGGPSPDNVRMMITESEAYLESLN